MQEFYKVQIVKVFGNNRSKVFESGITNFKIDKFERTLKSIQKHVEGKNYILWCLFSFSYGFVMRAFI